MNNPLPDPKAVVTMGNARFTVLTPQLIRMEWSAEGRFEDRASLVFINRRLPVPEFQVKARAGWLQLETKKLKLRYRVNSGKFTRNNLEIRFKLNGKNVVWHPGLKDKRNLRGTIRTLDRVNGATPLEPGLLSRDGWVLIDDGERPLLDDGDWPWVMPRPQGDRQDWYFFAHGHDYKRALFDFTLVAGKIPMPPRFAFGVWWSRYWAYTDQELKQLVHEFEIHDTPLDVLVIDMDWHQTFNFRFGKKHLDQAGEKLGWTGYTWDRILFPEPEALLKWVARKGLKATLNLHPASGIQPHEERYAEMAKAMGIDPATKRYVPFDIADKRFAMNYLEIMHHPLEAQGVNFWWLDWQQGHTTKVPGLNPTWWLNYVHFTDMERRGQTRPLIFHRWGGLGNHRYQIGFSGDTISTWKSLAFQPYFTAVAANVAYGYWSHDLGGHMPGEISSELYTRWLQFGIFSPIVRTHTARNSKAERRIWAYPADDFLIMRETLLLRYALIPYIYTAARQAYETGVSPCRPMYIDYPEAGAAYKFRDQYMFGDDLLVAPITQPVSEKSSLAVKKIWLPEGEWIEWPTGKRLGGPAVVTRSFARDEIPVYVKAGAIIPLQPEMKNTGEKPVDPLILTVFPGDSGSTSIYEDEGNSLGYQKGEFAWTRVHHEKLKETARKIEILPCEGSFPGMLETRAYEIRLMSEWPPASVVCNGIPIPFSREGGMPGWRYEGEYTMVIILLPRFAVAEKVEVMIETSADLITRQHLLDGVPGKLARLRRVMPWLNSLWPKDWSPDDLIAVAQAGNRMSLDPSRAWEKLEKFEKEFRKAIASIRAMKADRRVVNRALAHLTQK